jgi:two-component system, response regulator
MKRILLVEDREDNIYLFKHALKHSGYQVHLDVATDGEEAICFLEKARSSAYTSASEIPDLILLDLRMPKVDGFEVLQWIRKQLQLLAIPVVIFSTSARRDDMLKASHLGANSYIVKSGDLGKCGDVVGKILTYWLEIHRPLPAR